jgi:hypothetical protein
MKRLVLLIPILLLGFALRLYRLDAVPFRGDEAFSVQQWTAEPLSVSLSEIAALEPHPPLTYIVFRAWGLVFGTESVFLLRMLPLLCNMLGIPALFALAKRLSGQRSVGYLAAFFWAIHPFQIWHAQDFRNYGIWAGLSALVLYFGLRLIKGKRDIWDWGIYGFIALISSLIFYNELITIGVLGLIVLLMRYRDWRFILQWGFVNISIIALTIGTFLYFQGDLITGGSYGGTTGGFEAWQWWQRFLPELSFGETLSLTLLQQFSPYSAWWPLVLIMLVLAWILVMAKNRQAGLFLLIVGIVPLLVLGLISTRLHIFRPRYVLMAAPAYTLIISYSICLLWNSRLGRIFSLLLFSTWFGLSVYSLNNYYHNPAFAKAPDWPALIDYLKENTQAGEAIIQTGVDPAFGYYYDLADIAAGEFGLPADVTQSIPDVVKKMQETAADYHSIWIVGQTFPDWPNAGVVENWASENLQLVRETSIAGLPVHQFLAWEVLPNEISETALADFGETVQLRGARIFAPEPSGELTIWLYWQPRSQSETALKIFVHLLGEVNPATGTPLWSQDDQFLQNGRIDARNWDIETVYRDVYVLPLERLSAGEYSVLVGFYNPETNERLLLDDGTDAFNIGTVEIK